MSNREHTIDLEVEADGAAFVSVVSVNGARVGRFAIDDGFLRAGSATSDARARIAEGEATIQDLREVGTALFAAGFGGVVPKGLRGAGRKSAKEVFSAIAALRKAQNEAGERLMVRLRPGPLADLPWEALYDADQGRQLLGAHPLCAMARLVGERPTLPRETSEIRMLVAIPAHSGLRVEDEAKRIVALAERASRFRVRGKFLQGGVTVERIRKALQEDDYDVLHFVGHGDLDDGQVTIGLNDREVAASSLQFVPVESFLSPFQHAKSDVPLVVLNCCLAGNPHTTDGLRGLGPALIDNGVSAVVAMHYEISDPMAALVAEAFYGALFSGPRPGRPDVAVQAARAAILEKLGVRQEASFGAGAATPPPSPREVVNPILYRRPGDPCLFIPKEAREPSPRAEPERPEIPALALPPDLVQAVHLGLCVPVLGLGLFASSAPSSLRKEAVSAAPSLARALLDDLAKQGQVYPEAHELETGSFAWMDVLLLPRLCSHFLEKKRHRYLLTGLALQWIQRLGDPPGSVAKIARWRGLPGVVCTSFDRAARSAFRDREVVVFPRVDTAPSVSAGAGSGAPLLVHLRGTVDVPDSLVLTEQDHDDLWDRIARLTDEVKGLLTAVPGRSLLFLGVSPRDPWTRHLARTLLRLSPNIGPAFFVDSLATDVDEASWTFDKTPVTFVRASPEDVVSALSPPAPEGAK